MNDPNLPDPTLITNPKSLKSLIPVLSSEPVIAVDTESNSLYAYHERVCLIQISIPQADYLVDPLALEDLSPLAPIFADSRVEKVFHAAEYDLICLKRDFAFRFEGIFDTMWAAKILGHREVGLGAMLEAEFGVHLQKRHQRANWGKRPLPPNLLDYARLDTHYLIRLRDRLYDALVATGRWALAAEDFARSCAVNAKDSTVKNNDWWRIQGARELSPRQAAVLQELCRFRDRVAEARDVPVFRVVHNRILLAIAFAGPKDSEELLMVEGVTPGLVRRYGRSLLAAVRRGKQANPLYPPPSQPRDEGFLRRKDALRRWRRRQARLMGVGSDIVLPHDLMVELARHSPSSLEEMAEILQTVPWRFQQFGSQILNVMMK